MDIACGLTSKSDDRGAGVEPQDSNDDSAELNLSKSEANLLLFLYGEMSAAGVKESICNLDEERFYQMAVMKAPPSILENLSVAKLKEARTVRQVLRNLGYKSHESIDNMVRNDFLINMPLAPKVFKVVDALFGKPPEVVQGKAKRKKDFVRKDADTLDEHELALEWDLMFAYTHTFLVSVTVPHSHCMIVWLGCGGGEDGMKDIAALQGLSLIHI